MTDFEPRCDVSVPADLPDDIDVTALERMDAIAYLLDDGIPVPGVGYRVGLDPVVGLLPVAGDTAMAVVSLGLVAQAALAGVSRRTLARMVLNVAVDAGAGSVPFVGDAVDAVWKANRKNLELALADLAADETHSEEPGQPTATA